jgi:hypothetical protein
MNLDRPLHISMFRGHGFCSRGTKKYAESLGLSFKDLLAGSLTVRDLMPHKEDAFVKKLLKAIGEE